MLMTIKDLEKLIEFSKQKYPETYHNIPVVVTDDDEVNGIHGCYGFDFIDFSNRKMYEDLFYSIKIKEDQDVILLLG